MLHLAKKCINVDGLKCDSITEKDFYNALKNLGFDFEFQVQIELVGPAVHRPDSKKDRERIPLLRDRGIEAVKMTVDFKFIHDGITYYCDTKGEKKRVERDSKMRYDMLKHKLNNDGLAGSTRVLFIGSAEVKRLAQYAAYDRKNFWNIFLQIKER